MAEKRTEKRAKSGGSFSRWRRRRRQRREARHLVKETRRILRSYKSRLKPEVIKEAQKAVDDVQEALCADRSAQIRDRVEKLDEIVERQLAFGRKSALREYSESIGVAIIVALLLRAFVIEAFKIPSSSMVPTLQVGDHLFVNKFIYGLRVPFTNVKFGQLQAPQRGEVIVFVFPQTNAPSCKSDLDCRKDNPNTQEDESTESEKTCKNGKCLEPEKDFIKRIIAVGGDTVEVRNNIPIVNGQPIPRKAIPAPCTYADVEEKQPDVWHVKRCRAYEEEHGGLRYRVLQQSESTIPIADMLQPLKVPEGQVFVMGDNRDNSRDSRFWGTVPLGHIKGRAIFIWFSWGKPEGFRTERLFQRVHGKPENNRLNVNATADES